jgi:hypothetical protein
MVAVFAHRKYVALERNQLWVGGAVRDDERGGVHAPHVSGVAEPGFGHVEHAHVDLHDHDEAMAKGTCAGLRVARRDQDVLPSTGVTDVQWGPKPAYRRR